MHDRATGLQIFESLVKLVHQYGVGGVVAGMIYFYEYIISRGHPMGPTQKSHVKSAPLTSHHAVATSLHQVAAVNMRRKVFHGSLTGVSNSIFDRGVGSGAGIVGWWGGRVEVGVVGRVVGIRYTIWRPVRISKIHGFCDEC